MEAKENCWEFFQCGREPGGKYVDELGECPVPTAMECDGINRGKAAGRVCWAVQGVIDLGTDGSKPFKCLDCLFFKEVEQQEGSSFVVGPYIKDSDRKQPNCSSGGFRSTDL